jgi:hypothetical protein
MARISLLRLLIAAVGPLAATAAERGDRRIVMGGRSIGGDGWTLTYPTSGRPRSSSARQADVVGPPRRLEPLPGVGAAPQSPVKKRALVDRLLRRALSSARRSNPRRSVEVPQRNESRTAVGCLIREARVPKE